MTGIFEILVPILAFMAGGVIGEMVSYKTFGVPKNFFVFIIDIIFFIFLISALTAYLQPADGLIGYSTNFFIGLLVIPIIRGSESLLGLTKKEFLSRGSSIEFIQALSHTGMDKDEIKSLMKKIGYTTKEVDRYEKFIEKAVPAYLPKFVRMESMLERIEGKLDRREGKK